MDGTCSVCVVDNTRVLVAAGSGPHAQIAPEMEAFASMFGTRFVAHRVGNPNRKGHVENALGYVQKNFLSGRKFSSWKDLNAQARDWCIHVANAHERRALGMSAEAAYVMEKTAMTRLPPVIPPVYETLPRIVYLEGFVHIDTNRYSVPDRLVGKRVEVHKHLDEIRVCFNRQEDARHARLGDQRGRQVTLPGHHRPLGRKQAHRGPSKEETLLLGLSSNLDDDVKEIKRRSTGRGIIPFRRLLQIQQTYPEQALEKALEAASANNLIDGGLRLPPSGIGHDTVFADALLAAFRLVGHRSGLLSR